MSFVVPPRSIDPDAVRMRIKALLLVLFLTVTLATHGRSFHGEFVLDDQGSIVENESIRDLSNLSAVLRDGRFTTVAGRPLLNLSLAVNYALGGIHTEGYHLVNYLVHAAAALTLFALVRRILILFSDTRAVAVPLASMISLLWCVHPLTINAVSYVSQRAESIASLCYLMVLWAFLKGAQTGQRRWFFLSVVAAWLGALTKEIIATAPLAVMALDTILVTRNLRMAWRQQWRVYLSLLSSWIPLAICVSSSKARAGTVGFGMGITLQEHLQTQAWAIARYLRLAVWPTPLIFDYGDRFVVTNLEAVVSAAAVLATCVGLVVWLLIRRSPMAFPGVMFWLLLAPTSVIPIATQTVAEHRMYLASACVISIVVLTLHATVARLSQRSAVLPSMMIAVLLTLFLALSMINVRQTRSLRSLESVWTDTQQKHPTNQRAIYSVAVVYFHEKHDADAAERLCDQAIAMPGKYAVDAYRLRGLIFQKRRELSKALDDFNQAITLRPKAIEGYLGRATVLRDLGRFDAAIRDLDKANAIDPTNIDIDLFRGSINYASGEYSEALASFDRVLAKQPNHLAARRSRIRVFTQLNRWSDASQEIGRLKKEGRGIDEKLVEEVERHVVNATDATL